MFDDLRRATSNLPRVQKRALLILYDMAALSLSMWASYTFRLGMWQWPLTWGQVIGLAVAPVVAVPIFIRMGLYRAVIRYLPERAMWTIGTAMLYATVAWLVVAFATEVVTRGYVPRSVPVYYWVLGTVLVAGSRFAAKAFLGWNAEVAAKQPAIVVYGAGKVGAHLVASINSQPTRRVVAFVDESRGLHGRDVAGVRVFSPAQLPHLIERHGVSEVILSVPYLGAKRRREIMSQIGGHGVKVRTLPPLAEVVEGKYAVNQIREIDIDELLGRSSVPPNPELVRRMIEGRTIMVTGAGGSIGSELCRLIIRWAPRQLILFEANEFALYTIERELAELKEHKVVPVLGSVTDLRSVRRAIVGHGVEAVFHAAAHKHVPMVEANALEGIRNNIFGTQVLVDAALEAGVRNFVLISSDKAVRPTNVMGATKRWCELIVQQRAQDALQANSGQHFCAVRFGNVLGSNGSVVPLFKKQIAQGGPVTITDPRMTRYFMSIHEAAELIVQASAMSRGGDVFLLEMGEPILIRDLAVNMIRLAGFTVRDEAGHHGDIEIAVTGSRPGEKLFEELFYDVGHAAVTEHAKILRATGGEFAGVDIDEALAGMHCHLEQEDEAAARALLFRTIEELPASPQGQAESMRLASR